MQKGGCFCGALRYAIEPGERHVVNCHCKMCRRTSGAPFVTWILLSRDQFELTAGEPAVLKSSDHGTRWFCDSCGTPVAFLSTKRPHKIDVTVCSLDDPNSFAPKEGVYAETRLDWVHGV
jgi:hypothetical protein